MSSLVEERKQNYHNFMIKNQAYAIKLTYANIHSLSNYKKLNLHDEKECQINASRYSSQSLMKFFSLKHQLDSNE